MTSKTRGHKHKMFRIGFDFRKSECRITCLECGKQFYPTKTGRGIYERFWRKNSGKGLAFGDVESI